MKQLSDEAISEAQGFPKGFKHSYLPQGRRVAREAERFRTEKIVEWGEEYCQSGSHTDNDVGNDMFPIPRRDCHYCWQELSEEGR